MDFLIHRDEQPLVRDGRALPAPPAPSHDPAPAPPEGTLAEAVAALLLADAVAREEHMRAEAAMLGRDPDDL